MLRGVLARASMLGVGVALAACGGRVGIENTPPGETVIRTEPPTDDTTDAGTIVEVWEATDSGYVTPPENTCAQPWNWSFACSDEVDGGAADDASADAGPRPGALPSCGVFEQFNQNVDRPVCAQYCYGPTAVNTCNQKPTDAYASYLGCSPGSQLNMPRRVRCEYWIPGGRRPAAYEPQKPLDAAHESEVGRWLAGLAHLEAASVDAFRILRDELTLHGAPAYLVAAAERSVEDEIRHAAIMRHSAKKHGGHVSEPGPAPRTMRSLFEIARENAVEGCVRETFGALTAMWQAGAAVDPVLRKQMERIAEDEARHAALAWHVAAWAEARLSAEENALVRAAKLAAEADLDRELAASPDSDAMRWLGLPTRHEAARLRRAYAAAA